MEVDPEQFASQVENLNAILEIVSEKRKMCTSVDEFLDGPITAMFGATQVFRDLFQILKCGSEQELLQRFKEISKISHLSNLRTCV